MKTLHKTLVSGTIEKITFDCPVSETIVKNLSAGDIQLAMKDNCDFSNDNYIIIPKDNAQIICSNFGHRFDSEYKYNCIYLRGEGQVEIQCSNY